MVYVILVIFRTRLLNGIYINICNLQSVTCYTFYTNLYRTIIYYFLFWRLLSWYWFILLFLKNLLNCFCWLYWWFVMFNWNLLLLILCVLIFLIEIHLLCLFLVLHTTPRNFISNYKLNLTRFIIKRFFLLDLIIMLGYLPSMRFTHYSWFVFSISFLNLRLAIINFNLHRVEIDIIRIFVSSLTSVFFISNRTF